MNSNIYLKKTDLNILNFRCPFQCLVLFCLRYKQRQNRIETEGGRWFMVESIRARNIFDEVWSILQKKKKNFVLLTCRPDTVGILFCCLYNIVWLSLFIFNCFEVLGLKVFDSCRNIDRGFCSWGLRRSQTPLRKK